MANPGGRLTLSATQPELRVDTISSDLWYVPVTETPIAPIFNGTAVQVAPILQAPTDSGIRMSGAGMWAAGTRHDVFAILNGDYAALATAAWTGNEDGGFAKVQGGTPTTIGTGSQAWVRADQAFNGNGAQTSSAGARCVPCNSGMANFIGEMWDAPVSFSRIKFRGPINQDDCLRGDAASSLPVVVDAWNGSVWFRLLTMTVNGGIFGGATYSLDFPSVAARGYRLGIAGNGVSAINLAELEVQSFVSGDRGIALYAGMPVNSTSRVCVVDGGGTQVVEARQATHLGSIVIDANAAGQMTAHVSYGTNRRWPIWNAHNKRLITLRAGELGSGAYGETPAQYPAWGPVRGNADNALTVFVGQPTAVDLSYDQAINTNAPSGSSAWGMIGIGLGSVTTPSGFWGQVGLDAQTSQTFGATARATCHAPSVFGAVPVTCLASRNYVGSNGVAKFFTGEYNQLLMAKWFG